MATSESKVVLALLAAWLVSASAAQAMPPTGREADGLIRSIDLKGAMLTIEIQKQSRLRRFEWNRTTEFIQHGRFADPKVLKAGASVHIRYHAPFFGNPFVTKVTLLTARSPSLSKEVFRPPSGVALQNPTDASVVARERRLSLLAKQNTK